MATNIGWTDFKAFISGRQFKCVETVNLYLLFAFDGRFELSCIIEKDGGTDQADFESSWKSLANSPIELRTTDGREISAVNRIEPGCTIFPTGQADNIAGASYGTGDKLVLSAVSPNKTLQFLEHWYGIGGRVIWESASLDDEVNGVLVAPASTGFTNIAGDFNKYPLGGGANMIIPAAPGTGAWSGDLAAKFSGTNVLKATPVPIPGNTGYFNYDSETNVLTPSVPGHGGYILLDFDKPLFQFARTIFGRKQDGAESHMETTDVVGKMLFNTWQIRFSLNAVTTGVRVGIIITTAIRKNL